MKIDAMSAAAVGFAAFAAYYVLRRPSGAANSPTAAQQVFGMAAGQRQQSGQAMYMNTDWILNGMTPTGFVPNVGGVAREGAYVPWEG